MAHLSNVCRMKKKINHKYKKRLISSFSPVSFVFLLSITRPVQGFDILNPGMSQELEPLSPFSNSAAVLRCRGSDMHRLGEELKRIYPEL